MQLEGLDILPEMPKEYHLKNKLLSIVVEDFLHDKSFEEFTESTLSELNTLLYATFAFAIKEVTLDIIEGEVNGSITVEGCPVLEFKIIKNK